ncbi:MAG: ATP-binding protein [Myxococcota bacterium]
MIARTLNPPAGSFFLFGPRGTGKSTWVEAALPNALRLDLLHEATYLELLGHAERIEAMADAAGVDCVVIDEVQKLPALLDEAHRLVERRGFRFALTGSSARKLRRSGANLLAGRASTLGMHPFTATELGDRFDLAHAIRHGLLPTAWRREDAWGYLRSYVATYLREEVQQEALVRNVASFHRFLEAASLSQAQVLNVQAVAADCSLPRKTAESHFELVEDLLLAVRLPVFRRRAARKVVTHPKFFLFDAGVYRALRPRGPLDSDEEIDGAAIETLVFQSVRAENENRGLAYDLSYWRTPDGVEVDLVAYGPRGLHAFEVKRTARFREADLAALRLFCDDYPEARGHLLYGGDRRYRFGPIDVTPLGDALRALPDWLA